MAFLVPDTSTQLDNMLAKRDSLTEKIKDLGETAIGENVRKITQFQINVSALKRENVEITDVLNDL